MALGGVGAQRLHFFRRQVAVGIAGLVDVLVVAENQMPVTGQVQVALQNVHTHRFHGVAEGHHGTFRIVQATAAMGGDQGQTAAFN